MSEIPKCPHGHDAREAISALQKTIRRAEADDALYWATQLDRAGYGAWVWKRLRIIASEDVGLADPGIASEIDALHRTWSDLVKNKADRQKPGRLMLVHAVLLLAHAPKSRLLDWALIAAYGDRLPRREIPDVALDKHTSRGKRMGRGVEHFLEVGTVPEPHASQADEDRYRELARRVLEGDGVLDDEPEPESQAALFNDKEDRWTMRSS